MNIAQLTIEMAANVARLRQDMDGAVTTVNGAVAKIQRAAEMAGKALAGIGAGLSIAEIVRMADAVTELNNRLRLSTGSTAAAADAYRELYQIAQRSRVSFTELGNTFAAISRAGSELGVSQQRLLKVTEAIGNAMTISGGSAESMKAALVQLGQGLASGTLRGEELNSVMEQTPRLAEALAAGLGVPLGALRKMGEEGELTAEKVIQALESQSEVLKGEVSGSVMTVAQAFTNLQTAATKTVGDLDEMTGASGFLAQAIEGVSESIKAAGQFMRENKEAITITLGALGGAAVAAGIASVASAITGAGGIVAAIAAVKAAMVGLTVFMAANPVGLAVLGIGAVGGAVMAMSKGPDLSTVETQTRELERTVKRLADAEALLARAGGAGQGGMTEQLEVRIAGLKKYRDELSKGLVQDKAITEVMQADEKQWAAEHKKATAEAEASSKRLTDIKNELFKVDTKHIAKVQELAAQRNAGNISEAEYVKLVKMAVDANASKEKSSTKLSEAAKAQAAIEKEAAAGLELYSNLIAETAGFQGDYAEKVSQLAEAYAKNKISLEGLTFAHEKLLQKQPAAVEATKMEAEARKVLADAVTASARAYEEAQQAMDALQADTWQMVNDTVKASKDSAAAVQFELGLIGQTAEARRIAIEQRKIELDLEEKIKKVKATPFEGGEEAQLREINRLREAAAQDSATAISRIQLDEAAKSVEQYDKIFREGFAALIAGGKDSWKSFTKSLTTTFKTAVVDQIYKAFAQPFVVNVVANMAGITGLGGPGGAAGAGNSLANGIQTASSLNTLYGTASQAIYGATAGATAASLGYANAVGMVGGDALGALIAANGSWAGVATGSAAAAEAAIAANLAMEAGAAVALEAGTMAAAAGTQAATAATAAASTTGSLMSTVATAMPYLAAISAAAMIISSFDDSGTPHSGGVAKYSAGNGLKTGLDARGEFGTTMGGVDFGQAGMQLATNTAIGLTGLLDDMAKTFGKKAGYEVITAFADDSSGDGAWGALRINNPDGTTALNWDDTRTSRWAPKEFGDGQEGMDQYLKAIAADVKAYLISQAPEWAKTVFEGLGDAPTLDQLGKAAQSVGNLHKVLGAMGENVLPALADASDSTITALVKAAGGTDALTASMVNYYNSTATDLDRQQYAFKSLNTALKEVGDLRPQAINLSDSLSGLFGGLGSNFATAIMGGFLAAAEQGALPELEQLTLPEGDVSLKEWYNGLVESASALDLNVQGNADYLAGLLALSPAIDGLAEAWDATLEGIFGSTTLGALANAALRGDAFATAVINAAGGLEAFGEAITGYYDNFYTEGERAAMTTAQIEKELAKVGETMPKTREEFRALMDASVAMGEAGQPVVNALLEVQGAFASVTEPIAEAAAAVETVEQAYTRLTTVNRTAEEVANERISLQERLDAATATTAQIAEKARNAIDPYNRTLYDQVLAAEEAKAAAQALAQTQREVVAEMRQADIKLAHAMGDTALAERLQREAFVAGLSDLTAAQQAAKIGAYDYARAVDAQIAAMQRADTAVTSALAAVGRAVDAEKRSVQAGADAQIAAIRGGIDASQAAVQAAQDRVGELTRLFDDIAGAVKKLRGDVEPERQMLDARAYIDMSLSLARAGTLPDQQRLAEAISAVTSDSADRYSSMVDYQFAQKVQAGKLDELGGLVGEQKTAAEQQLEAAKSAVQLAEDQIRAIETAARAQIAALDAQLAAAREQVDVLRGVDNSVLSVAEAVNELSASIAGLLAAKGGVGGGGGGIVSSAAVGSVAVGSVAAPAIPGIKTLADIPSDFELGANRTKIDANGDYAAQTLLPGLKLEYVSNENASMIGQLISAYSGNLSQLAADYQGIGYTGTTVQGLEDWARQYGVPGFDQGAAVIPQDMLAMVHKGEQIIPAPWNPAASGIPFRGGGGNDAQNRAFERLTTEMSAMRAELAGLRQENAAMQRTIAVAVKKTADVQERYEAQVLNA